MRFQFGFTPYGTRHRRALAGDITRIKEEVALIYDDLVKSGKDFTKPPFKYNSMNSDNTFQVLIEFDKLGNLTNAYPSI